MNKQEMRDALLAIYQDEDADPKLREDAKQKLVNALGVQDLDADKLAASEEILSKGPKDLAEFQAAFEVVNRQRLKDEAEAAKQASDEAAQAAKVSAAEAEAKRLVAEMKRAADELAKQAGV